MNYRTLALLASALLFPYVTARAVVITMAFPTPIFVQYGDHFEPFIFSCDLNQDNINDFTLISQRGSVVIQSSLSNRLLYVVDPPPNIGGHVAPIPLGAIIGYPYAETGILWSSTDFVDGYAEPFEPGTAAIIALQLNTGWESAYPDYLLRAPIGVEFRAEDGIHYGYLDISAAGYSPSVIVHGWAYESSPDVAIQAIAVPEFSTLSFMSIGIALLWARQAKTRTKRTIQVTEPGRTKRWR